MKGPLPALVESLDLAALGDDRFEGRGIERERPRLFGGELLAQSLIAAARTAKDRLCHALHVSFLSPGDPARPIEYRVRRVSDGRRFARRQVTAWQGEREILLAAASFAAEADDARSHQHEAMPEVAGPEGLVSELEHRRQVADRMRPEDRAWLLAPRAVEVRPARPVPLFDPPPVPPVANTWLRAVGELPDDPTLHRAVLAYASDTTLLDTACYPHGVSWIDPRVAQASLDHAMWFHRPFRADEWLLHAQAVPVLAAGRAFARGSVFTRGGVLVASVTQEGLSQIAP
ncbi:MAG TPA: acyl-CoA thioesterase II [Candidatus Limnocylindrales bacterium]|nr:acyl-CoA thioesterase II [Candidatus Limnocylindrales bacterium]